MKNTHTAGSAVPALRPAACGIVLALAGLTTTPLMARELNGEDAYVGQDDIPESWQLTNEARLEVSRGRTLGIMATDSRVRLADAVVARDGQDDTHSVQLLGDSSLIAERSLIQHGGILLGGDSRAALRDSEIRLRSDAAGFGRLDTIGIELVGNPDERNPSLTLFGTLITVEDNAAKDDFSSGIGIRQGAGTVALRRGTKIVADNVGVLLRGMKADGSLLLLSLDDADIETRRGAALQVAPNDTASHDYQITVANGSTLRAGNGTALRVGGLPGSHASGATVVRFTVDGSVIAGDVIFDPTTVTGKLDVSLMNEAYLLGRFENVNFVGLINDARWHLTGDSTVRHLQVSGTASVKLGLGQDGTFNTLTVDNFEGRQGELIFNSVLGDDSSQTDRLVVTGDASGEARVSVLNAGGQGGKTHQGIQLIRIDGASDARFTLQGRAVGGQYEYFLVKGEDGSWYLRSQQDEQPEPPHECLQDPTLPQCEITLPVEPIDPDGPDIEDPDIEDPDIEDADTGKPDIPQPVLRPETGAYLANQAAMDQLLQHDAQTRMRARRADDGLRTWAATDIAESRQQLTGQQRVESNRQRLLVGADFGVFDGGQGRVGAMLSAGKADARVRSTATGYRAEGTVEGGALGMYAHWSNDALYLDASVQHGRFRNTVHGEGLQAERYDSRAWQSAIEAGYRIDLGRIGGLALHLQPQMQLSYTDAATDTHVESNGTVVRSIGASGLSTRVGLRLQGDAVVGSSQFASYMTINGYHDSRNAGMVFDGETVLGGLPRERAELNVGSQLRLGEGFSAWGELAASRGGDHYRDTAARIGAAWHW
ncbi:autotransporter outer membrane beta-barrel domain-containing protein [Stenotrophomonas sp.]|uniref:autotransporter family protein n=1 Tax=Stenotrophomonas sp. TaxID=69392 RepID=UPI0028A879B5|nr:autotransporter outer membrane beta-barrel domain-containing protein [Stenotrophomonas sp.]